MSDHAVSMTAPQISLGRAWLLINDAAHAAQIEGELLSQGWQVELRLTHTQLLLLHLHCESAPPDVLVCGLRYEDGDAFRLMRLLAGDTRAPALFFTSRQQRSVIKSAVAMAAACKLAVAGFAERPVAPRQVAEALREYRRQVPAQVREQPAELTEAELRAMLDEDRIQGFLQPQLRLDSREVVGVEALMRGLAADGTLLMPDRLVPALKRHGLLEEATLVLVRRTCEFIVQCLEEGMPLSGSINASLHSLSSPSFCSALEEAVQRSGLDPSWMTIEITESDAAADQPTVIENASRIRLLGFNLSIDDFGTAYSSLLQLSQLPFSELKIDRSFVAGIEADAGKRVIVDACARMARGLGLRVVAEGVETSSELAAVRAAGCTEVQGYLLERPMSMERMREWLRGLDSLQLPLEGLPAAA
ncbi:EAL domain-containing response regulator [Azohydromonas aeria]|uniref:EAL domain-containing response regulator n=1 Tax=Azohydromonas aeria TaxID=2590212 RepID=UPI0012FC50BE|nr:EAL domain-containing protein [Azohydromonas aeria]